MSVFDVGGGLSGGVTGPSWPFSVTPVPTSPSDWRGQFAQLDFNGVTNEIAYLGWNVAPGGVPADPSRPYWGMAFEHSYKPSAVDPDILQEFYLEWRSPDGSVQFRPFFIIVNETIEEVHSVIFQTEAGVAFNDYTDTSWGNFNPDSFYLRGKAGNNSSFNVIGREDVNFNLSAQRETAADGATSFEIADIAPGQWLIRVDGTDAMRIAGGSFSVGAGQRFGGTFTVETRLANKDSRPSIRLIPAIGQTTPLIQNRTAGPLGDGNGDFIWQIESTETAAAGFQLAVGGVRRLTLTSTKPSVSLSSPTLAADLAAQLAMMDLLDTTA